MSLWDVYVGTYTKQFVEVYEGKRSRGVWGTRKADPLPFQGTPSDGIEHLEFDDTTGALRRRETVVGDINTPQYLARHPILPVVYAAEFASPSRLLAFRVAEDGSLEPLTATASLGQLGVAVAVHPSGRAAYVAHWGDGVLTSFPLDGDGAAVRADLVGYADADGGERPYHHDVHVTPTGNAVLVTDNGGDELLVYRSDADGVLDPAPARVEMPEKSGPRHIETRASGDFVYVVGEWDSTMYVLAADDGIPTRVVGSASTVPPGFDGRNSVSALDLHPDGRTLFVGNRGPELVTTFALDDAGGVEVLGHTPSRGAFPSDVRVDPTGNFLIVANRVSGDLAVFGIDEERRLHPLGEPVAAPSARSVVFVERGSPSS